MSGHWPPYPAYRDSGLDWLTEIPVRWTVTSMRHVTESIGNGTTTTQMSAGESDYPVTRIETISSGEIDRSSVGYVEYFDGIEDYRLESGDVLLSHINSLPIVGNCALYSDGDSPLYHGMNLLRLRPAPSVMGEWLLYWLKGALANETVKSVAKHAINQVSVSITNLKAVPVLVPPPAEQRAIAAFLDRETSKIDTLIGKQQRLIEILEEKRAALISHAVTRGLDPDVPMKDSGIPWLGEIPEHWEVRRTKQVGSLGAGSGFPHSKQGVKGAELPFYKVSDMNLEGNEIFMKHSQHSVSRQTADELGAEVFTPGSIIFPKVGAALLTNKRRMLTVPSCVDNNVMVLTCESGYEKYMFYQLLGLDLERLANPGAVPSINETQAQDIALTYPPLREQHIIAAFLDREIAKIDSLVKKARQMIHYLQEYRTALISAAVTGKIDVREEVSLA